MTEKIIEQGLVPIGSLDTYRDRIIVFSNSHVHKVCNRKKNYTQREKWES